MSLPVSLLQLVSYGGIRSTAELARRLGTTEALVMMMAEDLRRRGYLQAVTGVSSANDCAPSGCASCGVVSSCKASGAEDRLPLLVLTDKGKVAATALR